MIKGVLVDLSGTLYVGNEVIPGARGAVSGLKERGIPVRYLTNTSRSTRQDLFNKT
ncbi:MAG: TIGR01458 family HAD-type hydrolase, partial [Desulfuromonadales bacterium]|nr:TIGR01458 family HAD-type hydrolase [Desulfuromonadales bacterium]NIS43579.1 TIGR01458 family HAD-type hydrolase [Desulfuromonadales bacterium]